MAPFLAASAVTFYLVSKMQETGVLCIPNEPIKRLWTVPALDTKRRHNYRIRCSGTLYFLQFSSMVAWRLLPLSVGKYPSFDESRWKEQMKLGKASELSLTRYNSSGGDVDSLSTEPSSHLRQPQLPLRHRITLKPRTCRACMPPKLASLAADIQDIETIVSAKVEMQHTAPFKPPFPIHEHSIGKDVLNECPPAVTRAALYTSPLRMEISSPGTIIQHHVENQVPGSANPTSNPSRNRRSNRPRTRIPPANAASSNVAVAPETEFPHLYSDLNEEETDIDLDTAFRCLSRLVVDDISSEQSHHFAKKVSEAVGPRDDAQSCLIASILSRSASQTPEFTQALMQALELKTIFDPSTLDEDALFTLLDASTNPDIWRLLKASWFLNVLRAVLALPTVTPEMKKACRRLSDQVGSWTVFEQALSGVSDADYTRAALFLTDIGKEEKSVGIWLSCITTHEDLLAKIRDAPTYEGVYPLDLMSGLNPSEEITHSEFMAFVRAYVGVASVLAVYAWSDSLPNLHCRERTLGVLRLWQEIPGYRAIISPLLLLPQMTFRLECMTIGNDPPTTAGINAEFLLFALAANPQSFLNSDFVRCARGWEPWSLTWINERERADIERAAKIADEGDNTESGTRCGDWTVLEAVWGEHTHGLLNYAIDVLTRINVEGKQGFSLTPSPLPTIGLEPLLLVTNESLHLIASLHALSITTSRAVRMLVSGVLDMYSCADVASHESVANSAVQDAALLVKHACANVLCAFSRSSQDQPKCGSSVVLHTLFEQGLHFDNVDPARRLLSAFYLVLQVLADDGDSLPVGWMPTVIPQILTPLIPFFRHLEPVHKVQLVQRLVSLDRGVLGLGDFLVQGEVKRLAGLLKVMAERGVATQWAWDSSLWQGLWKVKMAIANLYSKHLGTIARWLAGNPESLGIELRLSVVAALLRGVQVQEPSVCSMNAFGLISAVLETTDEKDRDPERLLWEVGHALGAVVESNDNLSLPSLPIPTTNDLIPPINPHAPRLRPDVPPSTTGTPPPKRKSPSQDILGLVAISPPTAMLRSPAVTGLTKTYTRNDFCELRQLPSARQNTMFRHLTTAYRISGVPVARNVPANGDVPVVKLNIHPLPALSPRTVVHIPALAYALLLVVTAALFPATLVPVHRALSPSERAADVDAKSQLKNAVKGCLSARSVARLASETKETTLVSPGTRQSDSEEQTISQTNLPALVMDMPVS
ncbi:hypothetical protein EV702DRAFT_1050759 [Suillus placidus]|uniref:Uncharacterized protein n=1 Tax=Suillus placidus TaxID=48579 RepID=A0A9P7CWM5_9AGAM|nr:hypothetical protein EV702DRAFT_1050759 [Suillus placidus]